MKRFLFWLEDISIDLFSLMKQNPASAFSLLLIPFMIISLLIVKYYSPMPPPPLIKRIVFHTLFIITGIFGLIVVKTKNAPFFAIPIRGKLAVLIGLFFILGSVGLIFMGLILDANRLLNLR